MQDIDKLRRQDDTIVMTFDHANCLDMEFKEEDGRQQALRIMLEEECDRRLLHEHWATHYECCLFSVWKTSMGGKTQKRAMFGS